MNWQEMVVTGLGVSVAIMVHMQRFVKPLLSALFALGAALLFKNKVAQFNEFDEKLTAVVRNEAKVIALKEAFRELYALWPYYVTVVFAALLAEQTDLRFYPAFRPPWNGVLTQATLAAGPSFIYDLGHELAKWREALKDE